MSLFLETLYSFDELLSSLEITLNLFISAVSLELGSIFVILDHF